MSQHQIGRRKGIKRRMIKKDKVGGGGESELEEMINHLHKMYIHNSCIYSVHGLMFHPFNLIYSHLQCTSIHAHVLTWFNFNFQH